MDLLKTLREKKLDGLLYVHGVEGYVLTPEEYTALVAALDRAEKIEAAARLVVRHPYPVVGTITTLKQALAS